MIGFSFGLGMGVSGAASPTTVYYIDSVSGSDLNDGTLAEPFASVAQAMSVVQSGEILRFARGSYFRESITPGSLTDITIDSYGTGPLPVFDCADVITGFDLDGVLANVYTMTVQVPSSGHHFSVWEDGSRLAWADSASAVESTPGSFFAEPDGPTAYTLYLHATDSGDPDSNGSEYEASVRLSAIQTASGWSVRNVRTKRNLNNNGSILLESGSSARGVVAEDGVKHNFFAAGNTIVDSCIAYRTADPVREGNLMFVAYTNDGSGQTVIFKDCLAVADPSQIAIAQSEGTSLQGFYVHTTGAGFEFDSTRLERCSAANMLTAIGAADSDLIETEACYGENVGSTFLIQSNVVTYTSVDDFISVSNSISGAVRGATVDAENYIATGLRTYTDRGSVDAVLYLGSDHVTVTDSTFYSDIPTGYIYDIRMVNSGADVVMTDNLFVSIQNGGEVANAKLYSPLDVDRNVYSGAAADFEVGANNYSSVANYLAAMQGNDFELSAMTSAVTLTDPSVGDFTVASATPGIPGTAGVQNHSVAYTPIIDYATLDAL